MTNAAPPIVSLEAASKSWSVRGRRAEVLRSVDLRIAAGESVAVTGPSGAGKSTLLHALALITPLDAGVIRFDGTPITVRDRAAYAAVRRTIGFVFQEGRLLPDLTVLQNVCVPLAHRNVWPSAQVTLGARALADVGLADRLEHLPSQLSVGESTRVAIARALVFSPRLVAADEPTGNLDPMTANRIVDILLDAVTPERALVIVTHDAAIARRTSRHLHLDAGRLVPAEP